MNALLRGVNRFGRLWTDADLRDSFPSKETLSRYLDGLEEQGFIARKRVSHKHVEYQIVPGQEVPWLLVSRETYPSPVDIQIFEGILRSVGDKAKAMDIAINYLFRRFFEQDTKIATALIMGVTPEHLRRRQGITREKSILDITKRKTGGPDASEMMIAWRSRRYYMFLRNLRKLLPNYPKHMEEYLRKRPWWNWPPDDNGHNLLRCFLLEKYSSKTSTLMKAIRDEIRQPNPHASTA